MTHLSDAEEVEDETESESTMNGTELSEGHQQILETFMQQHLAHTDASSGVVNSVELLGGDAPQSDAFSAAGVHMDEAFQVNLRLCCDFVLVSQLYLFVGSINSQREARPCCWPVARR